MNPSCTRRAGAILLLGALLAGAIHAQPVKPIKLVVPFPAGGTADVLPRLLAEKMRTQYPAGVVVENRTGAGGNIGAEFVFRADADGTTFMASPPGPVAINHHLYSKLAFDPTKWVPVTVMATVPDVLAVSTKVPAQTLGEFIAYLKANPGKVSYASQGNGSTLHLTAAMFMFMQITGTEMIHVPYKGTAPALVDLIGGNVDVFFDNITSSAQYHTADKLKVPTFAENRLPAMNVVTFFSIMAPPGTPPAAVAAMQKSVADALAQPDVRQKFIEQGAEPRGWTLEQTGRFVQGDSERWNKVIKSAKVTLE